MTIDRFEIRPANRDDRERVIKLMGRAYPGDMWSRYEWLYEANPHGEALTWLASERGTGEVVGWTSIFPRKVVVGGRERTGGIGGDSFVEPRVRRQGLATALHSMSFAQMRERGVDFMYGPPTPSNLGALVKAGSHLVTTHTRWVRPLTSRGAYRAAFSRMPTKGQAYVAKIPMMLLDRLTSSKTEGYTLDQIQDFGEEFDVMFQRASAGHAVVCRRDSRYLAWRYLAAPARRQTPFAVRQNGRLEGFVAIERTGELAAIVDLFSAPEPKVMDAIVQMAMTHAMAAGCSSIEIGLNRDAALARRVRRHGFIGRDERGFQVAVADADPQRDILLTGRSWHFTDADQDLDTAFVSPT